MSNYFLDTSALVKRYLVEVGSAWVIRLTESVAGNTRRPPPLRLANVHLAVSRWKLGISRSISCCVIVMTNTTMFD
jgi:predicted nucleic acid-binding protein